MLVIISIFPTLSDARTCHYQYVTQYVAHLRLARHSPNPKTTHMSDYQADVAGSQVAEPALCDPFLTLQSGFLLAVQFEVAVLDSQRPEGSLASRDRRRARPFDPFSRPRIGADDSEYCTSSEQGHKVLQCARSL